MSEYKEFFRQEDSNNGSWGTSSSSGAGGGAGGAGGGGGGSVGGGGWGSVGFGQLSGGGWYAGSAESTINGTWGYDVDEEGNVWIKITDFIWGFQFGEILKYKGRILKQNGRIQCGMDGRMGFEIWGTVGDLSKSSHVSCVLLNYIINGKSFNMKENDIAAENFFKFGMSDNVSNGILQIKFQGGHHPPEIDMVKLKFKKLNKEEIITGWIKLDKTFSNAKKMTFQNGLLSFE